MCSSSTTLFNAALRAGLRWAPAQPQLLHRSLSARPRRHRVQTRTAARLSLHERHEDADRDPGVKLRGGGGAGWVRYEIWGIRDGRTVSIGSRRYATSARRDEHREGLDARSPAYASRPNTRRTGWTCGEPGRARQERPGHPPRHVLLALRALERPDRGRPLTGPVSPGARPPDGFAPRAHVVWSAPWRSCPGCRSRASRACQRHPGPRAAMCLADTCTWRVVGRLRRPC